MKKYKKKTNGFETSIFGLDLFIKYIYKQIKINKNKSVKKNKKKAIMFT